MHIGTANPAGQRARPSESLNRGRWKPAASAGNTTWVQCRRRATHPGRDPGATRATGFRPAIFWRLPAAPVGRGMPASASEREALRLARVGQGSQAVERRGRICRQSGSGMTRPAGWKPRLEARRSARSVFQFSGSALPALESTACMRADKSPAENRVRRRPAASVREQVTPPRSRCARDRRPVSPAVPASRGDSI